MVTLASVLVSFGLGVALSNKVKVGLAALWSMVKSDASVKLAEVEAKVKEKV